ncbi:hypothetical protein CDD83_8781 [Cordyceps sp. RAO-2017]|nr:hypothetical protein CDD83_8781 [Cordyceps sp. RAO-2017]
MSDNPNPSFGDYRPGQDLQLMHQHVQAMHQHVQAFVRHAQTVQQHELDPLRHPDGNLDPSRSPQTGSLLGQDQPAAVLQLESGKAKDHTGLKCPCGKVARTVAGLESHVLHSLRHRKELEVMGCPSGNENSRPLWTCLPYRFETDATSGTSKLVVDNGGSGIWQFGIGYDYGLGDKDRG